MTIFSVGLPEFNQRRTSSFKEFISYAKGRSIISAGIWDDGRLEIGLSGGLMLRMFPYGEDVPVEINLVPTVNPGEIPPIIVALGDLPQQVPMWVIEEKLRGLRTLYAIYLLSENDRLAELQVYLRDNPNGDIERDLLADSDRLMIESMSYGSWLLAVWTKTKNGFKAISSVAGLVFERGREAYLRRLEAESQLLENQADRAAIETAQAQFNLQKSQMDYLLDVSDRIDSPEIKKQLKKRILASVDSLSLGDPNDHNASQRLIE